MSVMVMSDIVVSLEKDKKQTSKQKKNAKRNKRILKETKRNKETGFRAHLFFKSF